MRNDAARAVATAMACVMVAGCATPPAVLLKPLTKPANAAPLTVAMAYLDDARDLYRRTVTEQLTDEATLGDALIGAFSLAAGMAVGRAHRDAIFGTSLVAGTSYAIGNRRLARPRVAAYIAGLDALTCARRAVAPFNADTGAISEAVDELQKQLDRFEPVLGTAQALFGANGGADPATAADSVKDLGKTIDAAALAKQTAQGSLDGARGFLSASARAATQLVAAVDQIDTAVIKAIVDGTPTLASVPGVIGGLAGLVGTWAPGAGFDALVDNSFKSLAGSTAKSLAAAGNPVVDANRDLLAAAEGVRRSQAKLNGLLVGRTAPWPEDAFRDCNVAQVITPVTAAPTSLNFVVEVDARRTITLSGGVKPYFVEVDGEGRDGFTVKPPLRFDSRIEVSVNGSKMKQPLATTLLVVDSSPNPRPLSIPVVVASASVPVAPVAAPAPVVTPAQAPMLDIDQGLEALKKVGNFTLDNANYVVPVLPTKLAGGSTVEIKLLCPAGAPAAGTRPRILQALLTAAKIDKPLASLPWKLLIASGSINCPAA